MRDNTYRSLIVVAVVCAAGGLAAQDTRSDRQQSGVRERSSAEGQAQSSGSAATAAAGGTEKPEKVTRTIQQWRELLTPAQFKVLRLKDTEPAFRNKYDKHFEPGTYACAGCGQELFASTTKFNSGCGWPAFYAAQAGDRVILLPDFSHGMIRTEVICARCESHLGHIFRDAPQTPTGNRFCINSLALNFIPAADQSRPQQPGGRPRGVAESSRPSDKAGASSERGRTGSGGKAAKK